jgi:hypothetical protein
MRGVLIARVPHFRGRRVELVLLYHHPFALFSPPAFHPAHQFAEHQSVEVFPSQTVLAQANTHHHPPARTALLDPLRQPTNISHSPRCSIGPCEPQGLIGRSDEAPGLHHRWSTDQALVICSTWWTFGMHHRGERTRLVARSSQVLSVRPSYNGCTL